VKQLLLLALLAAPAVAQEQPADLPNYSVIQVIEEAPAHVYVTGGYEFASTGVTPNVGQLVGLIGGDGPVRLGKTFAVRPNFRLAFSQLPGATVFDPANFGSLEGMVGVSKNLSKTGGLRVAATARTWISQRLAHGDPLQPAVPATYGWGVGFEGHGDDGTHVTVVGGQDTYSATGGPVNPGGLQARAFGRIAIPGTAVGDAKVGSILFDARLSFTSPEGLDPLVPAPKQVTTVVLYGIAVEVAPLWQKVFHGSTPAAPKAAPADPIVEKKLDEKAGPTEPHPIESGSSLSSRLRGPATLAILVNGGLR
jgi:hypothetical protein